MKAYHKHKVSDFIVSYARLGTIVSFFCLVATAMPQLPPSFDDTDWTVPPALANTGQTAVPVLLSFARCPCGRLRPHFLQRVEHASHAGFSQSPVRRKGGRADIRLGRSWLHGALKSAAPRAANDFENLKSSRCPLVPEEKGLEDCLGESLTTN